MSDSALLSDQVVLVTGGTKGIGRGIVEQALLAGARVALCSRTAAESAQVADELNARFGADRCFGAAADLRDRDSLTQMARAVIDHWGRIDTLVCNAGEVGDHCQPHDLPADQFVQMLVSNVANNFHLVQQVAPQMLERGEGCILFVTSIVSTNVMPTNIPYATSKAAVAAMARSLAAEYAGRGVRVNCVAPGLIRTDASRIVWENPDLMRSYERNKIPMHRIGEPEEIGAACVFLASRAARYITAVSLPVDGGRAGIGQMSGENALVEDAPAGAP